MRLTLVAATVAGLVAGVIGGLVVVLLDDHEGPAPGAAVSAPAARAERAAAELSINEAVQRVLAGVVTIDVELAPERDAEGNLVVQAAIGTGLVLSADGYILTNEHVIRDAERLTVILPNGEPREADVVGTDAPFTDIAVLRIAPGGLEPVEFGVSSDLEFGQTVVAVGNALLIGAPTVTVGVVSNPDTSFPRDNRVQEFLIQTDAALNFGNSGGALITLGGAVVGLTTTVVRQTEAGQFIDGIGFALQVDVIVPIAMEIIRSGRFPRPSFGVVDERTVTPATALRNGLAIDRGSFLLEITQRGAFARAGLRPGDIVLSIGGIAITPERPYLNVLSRIAPRLPVEVVYLTEDNEEVVATITPELRRRP
ncbi:MAG: S1C family serine protease [Dehalococcoidia bacterium]